MVRQASKPLGPGGRGRTSPVTDAEIQEAVTRILAAESSVSDACRKLRVSKTTFYGHALRVTGVERERLAAVAGGQQPAWPPASLARLRELYAAGIPLAEIATRLGRSRAAVAAKAFRLGLTGKGGYRPAPDAPAPAEAQQTVLASRSAADPDTPGAGARFADLHFTRDCHWPLDDGSWCGEPTKRNAAQYPYCGRHLRAALAPPRPRQ